MQYGKQGSTDSISRLIPAGVDVRCGNQDQRTAIHVACRYSDVDRNTLATVLLDTVTAVCEFFGSKLSDIVLVKDNQI
jgi:hypothetical protein